jgi:membrane-associated phospholipid phosphatase
MPSTSTSSIRGGEHVHPSASAVMCGSSATARCAVGALLFTSPLAVTIASAQVTARATAYEIGDAISDVGYVWGSPLRADRPDWAVAGLSVAAFAALLPIDRHVDQWVVDHQSAAVFDVLAPFRERGPLTSLVTARQLLPISAALVLGGVVSGRRGLREAGWGCASALAASITVRYVVYALVARPRPSMTTGDPYGFRVPGGNWDERSFFAGHATNAFACTSFWNERFDLGVGEPVLYAGAALIALSRIADRRHWTSDTFAAVIVGTAIGRALSMRYAHRASVRYARGTAEPRPAPIIILWRSAF